MNPLDGSSGVRTGLKCRIGEVLVEYGSGSQMLGW